MKSITPVLAWTETEQSTNESTTAVGPIKEVAGKTLTAGLQYVANLFYIFMGVLSGVVLLVMGTLMGLICYMKVSKNVILRVDCIV
jgi:hypothetical protein